LTRSSRVPFSEDSLAFRLKLRMERPASINCVTPFATLVTPYLLLRIEDPAFFNDMSSFATRLTHLPLVLRPWS
jgi:hypothetical protein